LKHAILFTVFIYNKIGNNENNSVDAILSASMMKRIAVYSR